jgi:hypothetical protein
MNVTLKEYRARGQQGKKLHKICNIHKSFRPVMVAVSHRFVITT